MKWLALSFVCLLFLVACADEELPPSPPPPGGEATAGKATVGILSLDPKVIPSWALPLEGNVQVSFTDTEIIVKVKRPTGADNKAKAYILTRSYVFSKKLNSWAENRGILASSGKLADIWHEDYAEYRALLSLFSPGANYFVIFYCYELIDSKTGKPKRDDKGYKMWGDCKKYHLGGFEIGGSYPDILIEKQIENELFKGSAKADVAAGTAYTATYEDRYNKVKTTVTVTKLNNVEEYKKSQALNIAGLEPLWTKNGNVCGFQTPGSQTSFWWISGTWKIEVITFANTIASDKIGNYGIKYASDCGLLDKLKDIAKGGANVCGNGKTENPEQCDTSDDSVCPGACKPDCTCGWIGVSNTGVCGDYIIQKPNSLNIIEQCELPGMRDPITGQLRASSCFVRDNSGKITGIGACDDKCQCDPNVKVSVPACGNGRADAGEQCGDPGTGLCKANEVCKNCGCIPIPQNCVHNAKIDAGEKCDPTAIPTGCALSEVCSPTCVCAKAMVNCGNNKIDPGEQCEKNADCPVIPGLFGACIGCNCWYFFPPWPPFAFCGNGQKDPGEECEKDQDCANPPGGTVSPLCNKGTCKCNRVCGDGRVDSPNDEVPPKNEKCDPPGSKCNLPDGSIGVCDNNCGCVVGCGDGAVNAPEECDPPDSMCLCAIGPGGFISCKVCNSDCKCQGSEVKAKGDCPGVNCGEPNGYIKFNTQSYSGYGFGEHLTNYDTGWPMGPDTVIGSECWTGPCAETVSVDGAAVGQDGTCYEATGKTAPGGTPPVITTEITSYPKHCEGNYIVSYSSSTTTPKTCIESRSMCPSSTQCHQVTSPPSAACITTASPSPSPSPAAESRAWAASDNACGGNVPCPSPCPVSVTVGNACSSSGSTCERSGTVLTCMSGPDSYAGRAFNNVATGMAFRTADVTNSSGVQIALFIIASLAILLVTLLNFVHRE